MRARRPRPVAAPVENPGPAAQGLYRLDCRMYNGIMQGFGEAQIPGLGDWIPAFAGMTEAGNPGKAVSAFAEPAGADAGEGMS